MRLLEHDFLFCIVIIINKKNYLIWNFYFWFDSNNSTDLFLFWDPSPWKYIIQMTRKRIKKRIRYWSITKSVHLIRLSVDFRREQLPPRVSSYYRRSTSCTFCKRDRLSPANLSVINTFSAPTSLWYLANRHTFSWFRAQSSDQSGDRIVGSIQAGFET